MERDTASWLIPVLLAVAAGGGLWYYWTISNRQPVPPAPVSTPEPPPVAESGPQFPVPDTGADDSVDGDLRDLPALADSDEYFRLELGDLFGESVGNLLADQGIIEKVVVTVDNLPRGHVAERMRPVSALSGGFTVVDNGDAGIAINPDSYHRYDPLVDLVVAASIDDLSDLYRRYYPLFQKAYTDLGYPNAYFNDRLVEAIDNMLATPQIDDPVLLVRPHVNYEFADDSLQSLSSGQKLLIRMGPENAERIKAKLRELRNVVAYR